MPPPASAIPQFRCASSSLLRSRKPIPTDPHHIHRPKPISSLNLLSSSSAPRRRWRCGANSEGTGSRPEEEALSGMVDELLRREENKALLDGLEEASARVERAREVLADIERREADALRAKEYMRQLQNREAEIQQSQRELLEARAKVEEAQQSLSANMDDSNNSDTVLEDINREKERLESAKAAVVSSVAGTLASVPIYLYQATSVPQLILDLAVISISCALFGVTFRYTVRQDLDNLQLKTGTCAAFGLIKGLSAAETGRILKLDTESFISFSIDGAVYVSENIFIFLAAAVALDFCFKMRVLSPFPTRR
ncbi:hypothetical protein BHE74_00042535 [Ensete ventricosum]|nr:hypothetical protein BHE74_00042535 [Ensete ventricosum]